MRWIDEDPSPSAGSGAAGLGGAAALSPPPSDAELVKALGDPTVKERIQSIGFEAEPSTPEEFGQFVETELSKWQKIVNETGAKPE